MRAGDLARLGEACATADQALPSRRRDAAREKVGSTPAGGWPRGRRGGCGPGRPRAPLTARVAGGCPEGSGRAWSCRRRAGRSIEGDGRRPRRPRGRVAPPPGRGPRPGRAPWRLPSPPIDGLSWRLGRDRCASLRCATNAARLVHGMTSGPSHQRRFCSVSGRDEDALVAATAQPGRRHEHAIHVDYAAVQCQLAEEMPSVAAASCASRQERDGHRDWQVEPAALLSQLGRREDLR